MMKILKRELNVSIIVSIIYIILGIIIVSNPVTTLNIVSTSVAILSIIYGIIISIINIANIKEGDNLILGVLLIVLGISLLIYPTSLSILISLGVGISFISSSVNRIKFAVLIKDDKEFNWLIILFSAIITLLIGISFIFTPLLSAVALTAANGILMIVYSICDIIEIFFIKKNINVIETELEKKSN